jgi:AcrR family transcriptional regulator
MPARSKARRHTADQRREAVVVAAMAAFAAKGLYGTATEEIARRAGISQPYLFRLFGSKLNLFLVVLERALLADDPDGSGQPDRVVLHALAARDEPGVRALLAAARAISRADGPGAQSLVGVRSIVLRHATDAPATERYRGRSQSSLPHRTTRVWRPSATLSRGCSVVE